MSSSVSPDPESISAGIGFRFGRVHRALRARWSAALLDLGLSPPEAAVLRAISQHRAPDGLGVRALARQVGTDPMNAKRLADRLQERGLLSSGASQNSRRSRCLTVTDAGMDLACRASLRAQAQESWLQEQMGPERAHQLSGLLAHLEELLDIDTAAQELGEMKGAR
ncbi:MAG: MarR family transcriptional regulator [Actinobacteria bacterium]|nr:MarR family transcriptional regulator [Actinomycetota bacterium]